MTFYRKAESARVSTAKTQDQQKTPDPLHHVPAAGLGEEVPPEAVPLHCRARRVLQLLKLDGNPGENLVPEQKGQGEAASGGRTGKTENGRKAHVAPRFRHFVPPRCPRPRVLCGVAPFPEAHAASFPRGTVRCSRRIQYVPPGLTGMEDESGGVYLRGDLGHCTALRDPVAA